MENTMIKSKHTERLPVTPKTKYPCVKSANELIVLFYKRNEGVVMHCFDSTYSIGFYSRDWSEKDFELYAGTITLEVN